MKYFYRHPIIFSFLVGFFLLLINQLAVYFPYISGETAPIIWASKIKKKMNSTRSGSTEELEKLKKDFLLIDVSNDAQLYCDQTKADSVGMLVDNDSIARPCYSAPNLQNITMLFEWLGKEQNRNKYKYVICDLMFEDLPLNEETKPLLSSILNLQKTEKGDTSKIIFANYYDYAGRKFMNTPFTDYILPLNKGIANTQSRSDIFSHYSVNYDNDKVITVPLKMMERINGIELSPGILGTYKYRNTNGCVSRAYSDFIPEMSILNEDLDQLTTPGNFSNLNTAPDSTINKMELWQALVTSNGKNNFYLEQALKSGRKNIMIGSFNHKHNDIHKTLYGDIDGATILLNIYYNLIQKENKVNWVHLAFLFLGFSLIGFTILKAPANPYKGKLFLLKFFIELIVEKLHYMILLFILIFSAIVFNTISHVFVMVGIMVMMVKFLKMYKKQYIT